MDIPTRELEGRPHRVVPVVMLTEGVHCGSNGPLYYPPDEIRASVPYWDGKPVVVYHPALYGGGVAGRPDVFNRQKIGVLFGTRYEAGALKADAWIDPARAAAVDPRVLAAIDRRTVMEVSTGLFTENAASPGVWNGEGFHAVARNFRPDHLAVLPDMVGACSVADGAGLVRNLGGWPFAASA